MELSGKVKVIFDTQTFDSGFQKREFVVTTQEQYPQDIKFEVYKEKTSLLDNVKEGDDLTVHFNLRGNEYNGKYYVNLNAWKLDANQQNATPTESTPFPTEEDAFAPANEGEDDLPF